MSQYQDPYNQPHNPHHQYSDSHSQPQYTDRPQSTASITYNPNSNTQPQPRSSLHHQPSQDSVPTTVGGDRYSTYGVDDEKSFARPRPKGDAIDPDTGEPVRRSRFVGMGANGERPASQWTQGIEAPPKSTGWLREWRKENRAGWVKGGGFRTFCRFFSCCFISFLFVLISVILTILMWVRPPDVRLEGVNIPSSNAVTLSTSALSINFGLNVSVTNPNWFSANFKEITAVAKWPGLDANLGGGSLSNVNFGGNTYRTIEFPFTVNYTTADDPDKVVLAHLIAKCTTSPPGDITVDYDLTLKLKIIAVTISPTISSSASFACPVAAGDILKLGGAAG